MMVRSEKFTDRNHDDYNCLKVSDPSKVENGLRDTDQFSYAGEGEDFTLYEGPAMEVAVWDDGFVEYGIFREVTEGTAWEFAQSALSRSQDVEPEFQQEVQSYIENIGDVDGEVAADGGKILGVPYGGGETYISEEETDMSGVGTLT